MKKRLSKTKGSWVDEFPSVIWSYRTTPKTSIEETPFSLAYSVEAILPPEVSIPSARCEHASEEHNGKVLSHELDLLDKRRDQAYIRIAAYQQKIVRYFNKNIRARSFKQGDWVLRRVFQNT